MSIKTFAFIVPVALATALSAPSFAQPAPQPPTPPCPAVRDVLVTNGRIHTMDTSDTVVESVRIVGDRFAEVGTTRLPTSRCTRTIDLEGRTAVPGLIDNHNHIVLLGLAARPRHAARVRGLDRRRAGARRGARRRAAERRVDHVDRRLRHQSVRAAARRAALPDARGARLRDAESSRVSSRCRSRARR